MRKLIALFLLGTAVASAQTATPSTNSTPTATLVNESDNARKARTLLQQMIEKLGGKAYLGIRDMTQEGRTYAYYQGRPNSVGAPFWRFWMFPDKERVEFTKKRDVAFIHVGDKGYEVTYKGTAAEEPQALRDFLRRRNHSLENVLRVWLPDPKTALFWDGPAVAEQKPCDSITLLSANNDSVTIFVDSTTHLPVKKTFQWRDPSDRLKNEEGEVYDNYRDVQGVLTPHTLLRTKNGEIVNQRFITNVQYNTGLSDSLFQATVTYDPYKRSGPRK
ncbi:MAG TPA: hypothetical protein VN577_19525 [Terriglobales bacterium]|nr:hypothetical protein [Terriglobales bacterium]